MADDRPSKGWSLFRKKDAAAEGGDDDVLPRFLSSVARVFEGNAAEEALVQVCGEMKRVFECEEVAVFVFDPEEQPRIEEGDWVVVARNGSVKGTRVGQPDARGLPSLKPGKQFPASENLTKKALAKTIALAFEEDTFYGCDIENKKVLLVKDPKPEDDMGSGDLSLLALPLSYLSHVGREVEKTRVGVLALYKTPTRRDWSDLERTLRTLLAFAVVTPSCALRDPVTSLYTEGFLRDHLACQMNVFDLTGKKAKGGIVVGLVDTLKLYKQTLETAGKVDPGEVAHKVSSALRGVAACLWKRAREHVLGPGQDYRCGYPGRIGREGFGVVLPLLKTNELLLWAQRLQREVVAKRFDAEECLATGDLTVSLRVIPFGAPGTHTPEEMWKTALGQLDAILDDQARARRDPQALAKTVNTLVVLDEDSGQWIPGASYSSREVKAAPKPAAAPARKGAKPAPSDEFLDEAPTR